MANVPTFACDTGRSVCDVLYFSLAAGIPWPLQIKVI